MIVAGGAFHGGRRLVWRPDTLVEQMPVVEHFLLAGNPNLRAALFLSPPLHHAPVFVCTLLLRSSLFSKILHESQYVLRNEFGRIAWKKGMFRETDI